MRTRCKRRWAAAVSFRSHLHTSAAARRRVALVAAARLAAALWAPTAVSTAGVETAERAAERVVAGAADVDAGVVEMLRRTLHLDGFEEEHSVHRTVLAQSKTNQQSLALQKQAINPNSTVHDSGSLMISGWPIYNHDKVAHGVVGMAKVLQVSSNVGMGRAMQRLEPSLYWEMLNTLGIGDAPDTDLPGAVSGQLKRRSTFLGNAIEPATTAFGQGLALTPLKLLQLHGMFSNGGFLVSPHITRGLRSGSDLGGPSTSHKRRVLDAAVSQQVLGWMESVVEKGSGQPARVAGYRIGGKTGTAEKVSGRGYKKKALISSFVAAFPMHKPKYVVLAMLDEAKGTKETFGYATGGWVAAPVVGAVVRRIAPVLGLRPLKDEDDARKALSVKITETSGRGRRVAAH